MQKQLEITVIKSGWMVLPDVVLKGDLVLQGGRILEIVPHGERHMWLERADVTVNADGMYVMPGMIDMHCDAVEKEVQPRPNTSFPLEHAFYELDKKLAVTGITTMYHSVSLADGVGVRDDIQCLDIVSQFQEKAGRLSMVRHKIHLRYEVTNLTGLLKVEQMIEDGKINLLSYMDHTPGQGQFARPGTYEAYVEKTYGMTGEQARELIGQLRDWQQKVDWNALRVLAEKARDKGIALASHDDDSPAKVDFMMQCPLSISEFPINLETAVYARQQGLHTVVGAPNIVRGGSHSRNMRAIDAVKAGAVDMLCSDYHPASMLLAVFRIADEGITLPEAVRMVSLNPATARHFRRNRFVGNW